MDSLDDLFEFQQEVAIGGGGAAAAGGGGGAAAASGGGSKTSQKDGGGGGGGGGGKRPISNSVASAAQVAAFDLRAVSAPRSACSLSRSAASPTTTSRRALFVEAALFLTCNCHLTCDD